MIRGIIMPKILDHVGVPLADEEALRVLLAYAADLKLEELQVERGRLARIFGEAQAALAKIDGEIANLTPPPQSG